MTVLSIPFFRPLLWAGLLIILVIVRAVLSVHDVASVHFLLHARLYLDAVQETSSTACFMLVRVCHTGMCHRRTRR